MEHKALRLASLKEAKEELLKLSEAKDVNCPSWPLAKIIVHCAQTIEYSMVGYPKLKPKVIRSTVGKVVIHKFLKQGYMEHSLTAQVDGAPVISETSEKAALQRLLTAVEKFNNHSGMLFPHLLFGELSKSNYDVYFAMHIADHLTELNY